MFNHVQCCDIVPSLVSSFGESLDTGLYFAPQLPRGFDHFSGTGRGGEPPPPHSAGRGGEPPLPAGRGVHPCFGPLRNVDKPAMFGHVCLFYWCVYFGIPCMYMIISGGI